MPRDSNCRKCLTCLGVQLYVCDLPTVVCLEGVRTLSRSLLSKCSRDPYNPKGQHSEHGVQHVQEERSGSTQSASTRSFAHDRNGESMAVKVSVDGDDEDDASVKCSAESSNDGSPKHFPLPGTLGGSLEILPPARVRAYAECFGPTHIPASEHQLAAAPPAPRLPNATCGPRPRSLAVSGNEGAESMMAARFRGAVGIPGNVSAPRLTHATLLAHNEWLRANNELFGPTGPPATEYPRAAAGNSAESSVDRPTKLSPLPGKLQGSFADPPLGSLEKPSFARGRPRAYADWFDGVPPASIRAPGLKKCSSRGLANRGVEKCSFSRGLANIKVESSKDVALQGSHGERSPRKLRAFQSGRLHEKIGADWIEVEESSADWSCDLCHAPLTCLRWRLQV